MLGRQWAHLRLGHLVAVLLVMLIRAAGALGEVPANYTFLVGTGSLCNSEGSASCPAAARTDSGEVMEISGAGVFSTPNRSITAAGTYSHKNSVGEMVEKGVWTDVAVVTNSLAQLYLKDHRYAEAEPLFQRAWSIWEKSLGSNRPDLATSLQGYTLALRKTKQKPEAEAIIRRAEDILTRNPVVNPANQTIDVRALAFDNKRGWKP